MKLPLSFYTLLVYTRIYTKRILSPSLTLSLLAHSRLFLSFSFQHQNHPECVCIFVAVRAFPQFKLNESTPEVSECVSVYICCFFFTLEKAAHFIFYFEFLSFENICSLNYFPINLWYGFLLYCFF